MYNDYEKLYSIASWYNILPHSIMLYLEELEYVEYTGNMYIRTDEKGVKLCINGEEKNVYIYIDGTSYILTEFWLEFIKSDGKKHLNKMIEKHDFNCTRNI